jgi:hypothetical protein
MGSGISTISCYKISITKRRLNMFNVDVFDAIIESNVQHSNSTFAVEYLRDNWRELSLGQQATALAVLRHYPCATCAAAKVMDKNHLLYLAMAMPEEIIKIAKEQCIVKLMREHKTEKTETKMSILAFSQTENSPKSLMEMTKEIMALDDDKEAALALVKDYVEKGWLKVNSMTSEELKNLGS